MSPETSDNYRQILVYGPRKGGTTLLHRLIDSPAVFCHASETKIKYSDKIMAELRAVQENAIASLSATYFPYTKQADKQRVSSYCQELRTNVDLSRGLAGFIEADIRSCAIAEGHKGLPSAWCIKEVGGNADKILNWFLTSFPQGRVISIRRDPRFVARAVYRERRRRGVCLDVAGIRHQAREPWLVEAAQVRFSNHPRVFTLSYEKLVQQPAIQMAELTSFLDIPFDQVMTYPTQNGIETEVNTASKSGRGVFQSNATYSDGLTLGERVAIVMYALKFGRKINE